MTVNIIWQYLDASHVGGEDQDLGNVASGEESDKLTLLGHFETDLGISTLTGVGFYIGPYDGIYTGAHDPITDYNDLISYGDIRPIPLLTPSPAQTSTTTTTTTTTTTSTTSPILSQRGFLINQQPGFPDWGWQACNSLQGSLLENAIPLDKNACTPVADEDGVLVLGTVMKIKVKIALPSIVDRLGQRQVSFFTVYGYTS